MQLDNRGQNRVEKKLSVALKCISNLEELNSKKVSPFVLKRIESNKARLQKKKQELVFLSTRARDKITRFYASNALKEIAQNLRK
jgi:hypothetical protein